MTIQIDPERAWIMAAIAASKALVAKGLLTKEEVLAQLPPITGETLRMAEDEIISVAGEMIQEWPAPDL